jgi:hypothetical protein
MGPKLNNKNIVAIRVSTNVVKESIPGCRMFMSKSHVTQAKRAVTTMHT